MTRPMLTGQAAVDQWLRDHYPATNTTVQVVDNAWPPSEPWRGNLTPEQQREALDGLGDVSAAIGHIPTEVLALLIELIRDPRLADVRILGLVRAVTG